MNKRNERDNNHLGADLQITLGVSLQQVGDLEEAVACYRKALILDPDSYGAYNNLGNLFASLGDFKTALVFLYAARALNSNVADIHNNIANVYLRQNQNEAAIDSYMKAIALAPITAIYHNHLGSALHAASRYLEAEECFRKALALDPESAEVYANLGYLAYEQHNLHQAESHYRRAITIDTDFALAHVCLGQLFLLRGEFNTGWAEQEWRWKWKDFPSPKRKFTELQWSGEEVQGKYVFLHAEQGFGDTIQFIRYIPMVAGLGAKVIVEVHPELFRLVESIDGIEYLVSRGDAIPKFDFHCPLMSLPLLFATTLETIPSSIPYIRSLFDAPEWIDRKIWNKKKVLRVGVVWAGNPNNKVDHQRSLSLEQLTPLGKVENVAFYCLQRGSAREEVKSVPFPFAGILPETGDFALTAAAVESLDLIVTIDSAVAHLAGALGKPVWILLPHCSDWRWLLGRDDSPWYPSAKLYRQDTGSGWERVIRIVATDLSQAAYCNS